MKFEKSWLRIVLRRLYFLTFARPQIGVAKDSGEIKRSNGNFQKLALLLSIKRANLWKIRKKFWHGKIVYLHYK